MFATSGVQLEELRAEGFNAFAPYKVILLDEASPFYDTMLSALASTTISYQSAGLRWLARACETCLTAALDQRRCMSALPRTIFCSRASASS